MAENLTIVDTSGDTEASLLEMLDTLLNKGIVIHGSLVISLAGVDLVYVGLNAVLTSVETARRHMQLPEETRPRR